MTRQTFYRNLKKAAPFFNWTVDFYGAIRGHLKDKNHKDNLSFCPITAVYYARTAKYLSHGHFIEAANYLKMNDIDQGIIAVSADTCQAKRTSTKACRKALLRSTGLPQE